MGSVVELWRHPVKSMQGERLDTAEVVGTGFHHDRTWALKDDATGKILTGRRTPALLDASAELADDGPVITLPDGTRLRGLSSATDDALSSWLGQPVRLVSSGDEAARDIEMFEDATDDDSEVASWTMPTSTFVDVMPLLLVTTASLRQGEALHPEGQWLSRRFRPNVVIDVEGTGWVEDGWRKREVRLGDVVVVPREPCLRCSMITRPQPGIDRDLDVFKVIAREHGSSFGIWASVSVPGLIRADDEVVVADA
jgi:uncharacterized protein YcbX